MAVATCGAIYDPRFPSAPNFVVGVIDLRNPPPPLIGLNWGPPMYHGPNDSWTAANLGQIFGTCIDVRGNIYVTATSTYGNVRTLPRQTILFGPGGPGAIYKLDGTTGAVSTFAQLPNSGPALGNICYDRDNDQLFVTNFEDGKIYRLSMSGAVLSVFDSYAPDNGSNGFAPLGERPWGIGVYDRRVYYGVWWQHNNASRTPNEVRSIGLDPNGEFMNDDRREFQTPPLPRPGLDFSSPVSDITFSNDGRMLLAERSMQDHSRPNAHLSRVMEYGEVGGSWTYQRVFHVGNYTRVLESNSAGGVDFGYGGYDPDSDASTGCDEVVWASGDALRYPSVNPDGLDDYVYGLARIPATGNSPSDVATTSYYIDLDGNTEDVDKSFLGDVAVFRFGCLTHSALYDTVLTCGGDTVPLTVPPGAGYRWTPPTDLNCIDCRTPLAFPNSDITYTVEVLDGAGGIKTYYRTILATPRSNYTIGIGEIDSTTSGRQIVPVRISPAPDPSTIERFIASITYADQTLFLENGGPPHLAEMIAGTIADGWNINVLESRLGFFKAEFTSSLSGEYLRDSGTLLHLVFTSILMDYMQESPLTVAIDFPDRECIAVTNASGTINTHICGGRNRLIEFTAAKYALNVLTNAGSGEARIDFGLGFDGDVRIEAFDLLGVRIALLVDTELPAGAYSLDWNPNDLPAGIYCLRMTSGSWSESELMMIRK